jgi:purine-nucleoside phosphorylase
VTAGPGDPFALAASSAARLAGLTGAARHDVAVVLGSGWAPAADALGPSLTEVPVTELGGFRQPPSPGMRARYGRWR